MGDRAEEIVYRCLGTTLPADLRDLSALGRERGEQPGWDVEYRDAEGNIVGIEVKGTQGGGFASIDITANEWEQAQALLERYWLFLVTSCMGPTPRITRVQNPFARSEAGQLSPSPMVWRLTLVGK
jgi:hypothetical protein